jgi:hypothetical protein
MKIIGGSLAPMPHDDSQQNDTVYGVDANGFYLGVVPATIAVAAALSPPPKIGRFTWNGSAWQRYAELSERIMQIEQARDDRVAAGFTAAGIDWPADDRFKGVLLGYLQMYAEGALLAGDTVPVRSKDKVVRQLTRAQVRALVKVLIDFVQAQYQWSWDQKALIGG